MATIETQESSAETLGTVLLGAILLGWQFVRPDWELVFSMIPSSIIPGLQIVFEVLMEGVCCNILSGSGRVGALHVLPWSASLC